MLRGPLSGDQPQLVCVSAPASWRPGEAYTGLIVTNTPGRSRWRLGPVAHRPRTTGPGGHTPHVLFAVGREDDIAWAEFNHLLSARLDQAAAFGDVQGLPPFVGMPGTPRSGREVNRGHVELGRRQAPGDGIDPHLTGEDLSGAFCRCYVTRDVHNVRLLRTFTAVLGVGACRRSPGREFPEEVGRGDAAVYEEVAAGDERTVGALRPRTRPQRRLLRPGSGPPGWRPRHGTMAASGRLRTGRTGHPRLG